jgi:enoyl-CoA hydratase
VTEPTNLLTHTEALINEIRAQAPLAVQLTWEALHRGLSLNEDESALLGADFFGLTATTNDFREGTRAFLEKRSPTFRGD